MSTSEKCRTIDASPQQIWAVLREFDQISQWASNVDHSCFLTDQATGVGTVRRIQSGPLTVIEAVTDWTVDRRLGYTIEGLPPAARFISNTWTIEPVGDRSNVTLTTIVEPGPKPVHKVVARIIGRKLSGASDQMLNGLAIAVAQQGATS